MPKVFNRARMTTASAAGTGAITLGSAVSGYQTFANAGAVNGDVIHYTVEDGTAWEIGTGTFTAPSTLSRTLVQSSTGSLLNLTASAQVFITAPASAVNNLDAVNAATARTNLGLVIGTNVQAWDADLDAIAAISSTSGLLRKTALNTFDLGSVRTKMRVFLDGGQYIPSAGTKSILVYLTGSGASGGSVITTNATNSTTFGAYCATGGSGAGTIVFSMDATPADEFQVSIGAAPAATPASGTALALNGNVSRFNKMVSGSPVNIATAPGGVRGTSNLFAAGMSGPVAPAAIAAPDPAYVASGQYLAIPGGMGEVGVPGYGGTGNGGASNGRGGSSFWGSGAGQGAIKNGSTGGGNFRSGENAVSYGSGGAGGVAIKYSSAGVFSATGGAGAKGICVIIEVLN
jgi:predicted regulator of Ras-like GTPase activity (Roadblock/LC7/MglB family)